jgi:hypothetical protein
LVIAAPNAKSHGDTITGGATAFTGIRISAAYAEPPKASTAAIVKPNFFIAIPIDQLERLEISEPPKEPDNFSPRNDLAMSAICGRKFNW